ncbi:DsrE family protein [Shewanella sp. AS1]|uniref:DsrE family protein n=1 Tax=Shewanella sp. AS1 TaxID=2907626 RepID=UPI001F416B40|nr:DsrE family protein [Shewanella sp. AS1]MCE9677887.1 DsrE family protein [Shewanella sp. AS1]
MLTQLSWRQIRALVLLTAGLSLFTAKAFAGADAFQPGPVFKDYGHIAKVDNQQPIPEGMQFKVVFDTSNAADAGKVNRHIDSLARFINMHVANGVKPENIELALVVHGKGVLDLTQESFYSKRHQGAANVNIPLIKALTEKGVKLYVCGQTAAYFDVTPDDLLPGVTMALSAMTAHAILAKEGYSLNPF